MNTFLVSRFLAISTLFLWSVSGHAQLNEEGATSSVRTLMRPMELVSHASTMFAPELADQIQEQIQKDVVRKLSEIGPGERSIATLFLGDIFYKQLGTGLFVGAPSITWNGYDRKNSRPTFLFQPDNFTYVTSSGRQIVPGVMDTDGGSIPKLLHSIGNFTPWTYAPAYIVHDWLFVAHKCGFSPDNDIQFESSALILAESLKTLMEIGFRTEDESMQIFSKAEDTVYLIYQAVRSPIARRIWDDQEDVNCR